MSDARLTRVERRQPWSPANHDSAGRVGPKGNHGKQHRAHIGRVPKWSNIPGMEQVLGIDLIEPSREMRIGAPHLVKKRIDNRVGGGVLRGLEIRVKADLGEPVMGQGGPGAMTLVLPIARHSPHPGVRPDKSTQSRPSGSAFSGNDLLWPQPYRPLTDDHPHITLGQRIASHKISRWQTGMGHGRRFQRFQRFH